MAERITGVGVSAYLKGSTTGRLKATTSTETRPTDSSLPFAMIHASDTETTLVMGSNGGNPPVKINDTVQINYYDSNIPKTVLPFLGSIIKVKADDYSPVTGRLVSIKQNEEGKAIIWLFTKSRTTGHAYISFSLNQKPLKDSSADIPVKSLTIQVLDANPKESKNSHYLDDMSHDLALSLDSSSIDQRDVDILNWLSRNYESRFINFNDKPGLSSMQVSDLHRLNSIELEDNQITFNYDPHKTFFNQNHQLCRKPLNQDAQNYSINKNSGMHNLRLVQDSYAGLVG